MPTAPFLFAATAMASAPLSATVPGGDDAAKPERTHVAVLSHGVRYDVDGEVGYAFRVVDGVVDDRAHGGAASIVVDARPNVDGFGARVQAFALGFPAGDVVARPLALHAAGPAVVYAFDDTDVLALAHAGVFAGVAVDGARAAPAFGADVGLQLRFPLGRASHVDVSVGVPVVVDGDRLGLQTSATAGLGVSLDRLGEGVVAGEGLAALLLPAL